ncbi:hypothetical protein GINT2_002055 [Glugoides intestinalis]
MKIFDIQKALKYIFLNEKRPHYMQLNPKPKVVTVAHLTDLAIIDRFKITAEVKKAGSYKTESKRKAVIEKATNDTCLSNFEAFLDSQGYLRVHVNENMRSENVFKNILKCIDIKTASLSLITEENLKLVEKHDIKHMFSYSNFIKSNVDFDSDRFVSYRKPVTRSPYFLLAIDCEMMQCEGSVATETVSQVGRVSIVDHTGNIIYDKYIKPESKVIDYLERYSGLNKENTGAGITKEELIEEILSIIGTNTYLLGHGLENDLEALNLYTENVIDTSYLFLNTDGFKIKLSQLSRIYFGEVIQEKKHSSAEDAFCCLKLLTYKIAQLKNIFDPEGSVLKLGVEPKRIEDINEIENEKGLYFVENPSSDINKLVNMQFSYTILIFDINDQCYLAFKQRNDEWTKRDHL